MALNTEPLFAARRHRLDLATLTTEANRPQTSDDPVLDAIRAVRARLAERGGEWLTDREQHQADVQAFTENTLAELPLTERERAEAFQTLHQDLFGWGRLNDYMLNPNVTEILVDGPDAVDVEEHGLLRRVPVRWRNNDELLEYIKGLIAETGRPLDAGHPIVDAEVKGARINATAPPVSPTCTLNIRKSVAQTQRYTPAEYVAKGGADWTLMRLILALSRGGATSLVCGPMGSGKSTVQRQLIEFGAPDSTRWAIIEDVREILPDVMRVISLQTVIRSENPVTTDDLFRAIKRKRPDRVGVGEVRSGAEALVMLLSVMMGHYGSASTTHAGSPDEVLYNFLFYLKQAGVPVNDDVLLEVLHRALDILIFVRRFRDGRRRITRIVEVVPRRQTEDGTGFRDLMRWDRATNTWQWVNPISDDLAERLVMEGVRVPTPQDGPIGPDDILPSALDIEEELA